MHEHEPEGAGFSKSHLLIMALCCLIPVAIILVIVYVNIGGAYFPYLLVLTCPLLMILMHLPRMRPRRDKEAQH